MFNLFNKKSAVTAYTEQVITKNRSTKEIIEEIHESFYTEVDKLLADAKIAKSVDTDKQDLIDKCAKLKALGFKNTKEVVEAEREIERLNKLKRENQAKESLIEAINYFSFKYPNYKFITQESVKKICSKYNLIYGDVKNYIGTVPDKNLKQIEEFKIQEEDELYELKKVRGSRGSRWEDVQLTYLTSGEALLFQTRRNSSYGHTDMYISESLNKASLEIAAPASDFNLKNMDVMDFKLSKIEVPDPIVLQPVLFKDVKYYLIVTAWGIEASDINVVNEKLN